MAPAKLLGIPKVTRPAPARIAAPAHKMAAPENLSEPAKIKICPNSPLCALGFLRNNSVGNRIIFHMENRYMHIYLLTPTVKKIMRLPPLLLRRKPNAH